METLEKIGLMCDPSCKRPPKFQFLRAMKINVHRSTLNQLKSAEAKTPQILHSTWSVQGLGCKFQASLYIETFEDISDIRSKLGKKKT